MKKLSVIILLILITVNGCKKPDNAIYNVLDNTEYGAVLRTLERVNTYYNSFDTSSTWAVKIEEQDEESGDLLEKVNVYSTFVDNTDDGVDNNKAEILLKSYNKDQFTTSANGLPSATIESSLAEELSAFGLNAGEWNGGDKFIHRLELVLTNGKTYSLDGVSGSLLGSYFNSPFAYEVPILCIPASPITGDYILDMYDGYGDGWQGSKITVTIDGVATDYSLPNYWNVGVGNVGDPQYVHQTVTVTVPAGAQSVVWSFTAGDYPSEVSFTITGPNSGNIIGDFGPNPPEGELNLNYCNE